MAIRNKSAKVLIIDDQPLTQNYVRYALERLGYKNLEAVETARAATRLVKEIAFDIILCAFDIAQGPDGFKLFERLKHSGDLKASTAFIFISADTDPSLVHSVLELQPDDFLVKPFNLKELELRLSRVLKRKASLLTVNKALDTKDPKLAILEINKALSTPKLARYYSSLLKLKGELLLELSLFKEAQSFYLSTISVQPFTWAKLGLVKSLLAQDKTTEAEPILSQLLEQSGAQVITLELLSQLRFEQKSFESAQALLEKASQLAPRNIERLSKVINLSRINHDYQAQYDISKQRLKFGRQSVHDSPELYLTAARSSVDLAMTMETPEDIGKLSRQVDQLIQQMKHQHPNQNKAEELEVIQARLCYLNADKEKAKRLVNQLGEANDIQLSIEALLDKAKACHEVGLLDQADRLFEMANQKCAESDPTLSAYVQQESKERQEIQLGYKELNNTAVKHYERGRTEVALETFLQAHKVMPKSPGIALNLLQTLWQHYRQQGIPLQYQDTFDNCQKLVANSKLTHEQASRYELLMQQIYPEDK